jgi:hypothetical protein
VVPVTPGMEVVASLAPLFVTGEATDFFKYGVLPLISAGYRFPFAGGAAVAAFQTGYTLVIPDDEVLDATVRLVPLGAEISYSTLSDAGIRFTGHLSGGPAILMVTQEGAERLAKTIFFVRTGVGGSIEVNRFVSLGIDASYTLFFEEELPLMGFAPAFTVRTRF